jgi:GT2 family glycosyltransferase/predicted Zn-dependent protease
MPRRYLFGPVNGSFAEQNLAAQRAQGNCLCFGPDGTTDIMVRADDTWAKLMTRLPTGWRPDFVVLYLPYTSIPDWFWTAPIPLVGIATDWQLLWHYYRRRLRSCDLVLSDPAGVEALLLEGISQARPANLYGCERDLLSTIADEKDDSGPRDIDILFVGNLNAAVQAERLPWLIRLARLQRRWRVSIRTAVFGDTYRKLLRRAKIVFSYVEYPRCSRRHAEATAAGALLFEHTKQQRWLPFFRDREECVFYDEDNVEALLEYYLEHEDERRRITSAARAKAAEMTFERIWEGTLAQIERIWTTLAERPHHRAQPSKWDGLSVRLWQACHAPTRADRDLLRDVDLTLAADPNAAALHNMAGLAVPLIFRHPRFRKAAATVAAVHFEKAVSLNPSHIPARLNFAEALIVVGDVEGAIAQCREALTQLARTPELDPGTLDGCPFHSQFDDFRAQWERAAWSNAGNARAEAAAKKQLLYWRFRLLLARLTGDLVQSYEAYIARPDLPASGGALGVALASKGYHVESLVPLRQALARNPFDREAARALGHMLSTLGDRESLEHIAEDRRLLSLAAPLVVPPEPWFGDRRPTGTELASIIILCCNQLDYTRQCLASVLKNTRPPYELVLIDNGSTDGTQEFLAEFRSRSGPVRVDVIRNEWNVGYPAGCNQGLARSRGRYLVFLNNDTVVTSGWLDALVEASLSDWPHVGLVGPVTNYAPDLQGVRPGYAKLDGLEAFAARRRKEFGRRYAVVPRLTGFCLLTRREVMDRIGNFDERFGLGFFDDDDLCLRAREVGVKLLVALGVYIHHFGSQTFKGLGVETREQLLKNFALFREKWGVELTAGYRLPEQAPVVEQKAAGASSQAEDRPSEPVDEPTVVAAAADLPAAQLAPSIDTDQQPPSETVLHTLPRAERPNVSLCMIVKNEEARLGACLESVSGLFDEVVVVDTGSNDRTKEVANRFGVKLADFPWTNDFAAARNESLRHATGRWIMWLDADDRIDPENYHKLRELFTTLGEEVAAYAMRVRSVMDPGGTAFRLLDQVRLFPNHPAVRWEYRIHEQILPAVNRLGGRVRWTDVVIDHVGYQDPSVRRGKLERNLRLLELDVADRPDDSFTLFNYGWTLLDLGRTQEALGHLERSLALSSPDASIARKLFHLIAVARRLLGQKELAQEACREGLKRYPDDTELLLEEAMILLEAKEFEKAEANMLQLLESEPAPYFGSCDDGVRGFQTMHLLALHYLDRHRVTEAEVFLRAATQEKPRFLPAWLGLGELLLRMQRFDELMPLTKWMEHETGNILEGAILRARAYMTRLNYPAARSEIEQLLPAYPEHLGLRVLLSHILLREDRSPSETEIALREVLRLDPANAEAWQNLAVLRQRSGCVANL